MWSKGLLRLRTTGVVWGLLAVLLLLVLPLRADIHPVPLDKNTDAKKCLECHEDKAKGKNVHTAISMGCLSCHEIRVNKDITRVKLLTTTPSSLCFTCHADKNPADIKGVVHTPARRDCLKCHDPHQSDNKFQLLKPAEGGAKENLCLSCHSIGLNVPEKGSRHAALDMGCETCHVTHKTGERGKQEFDFHLTKATPALCIDCHDPKDAALQKAHQNQPFGTANCVQCHDPHQSNAPKLLARYTHPPFADKQCEVCHAPAKDGKVVLTQPDAKSLCVMCHDEKAKQIESAKVPHPGALGDCTDCHNPHASKYIALPKTNPVEICLGCHSDIAELAKKPVHHQPAFVQGCGTCHQPHGGERAKLLRAQGNALCLECHGPDASPVEDKAAGVLKIFNGTVRLPDDYYKKNRVPVLPLKYGKGHPITGHPVSDVADPSDLTKVIQKLTCLTCHQPHSSLKPNLLVNDQENNTKFCATCHKDLTKR
ncbi:MAG TPA: cytochrome c3 family protein [Candidatus Acidoferrum sp.]|nr:cytochrome c3 family protein [Candidatus Acidoferrum sp.]